MKKAFKSLIFIIILTAIVFNIFTLEVHASGINDETNTLKVYDELELKEYIEHSEENKYDLFFVIVNNTGCYSNSEYAKKYFEKEAKYISGAVILINDSEQTVCLEVFGKLTEHFTKGNVESYSNTLTNLLSFEEYYEVLSSGGQYITSTVDAYEIDFNEEKNISFVKIVMPSFESILIGLVIGGIVIAIFIVQHYAACKKVKAQLYLDNTFTVESRDDIYLGDRTETIRDYYKKRN